MRPTATVVAWSVSVCFVCWSGELYKTSAAAQGPKPPKNLTAIDPRQAVLLYAEVFQPPQQRQSAAERRHLVAGHVETSQRRDRVGRRQVATDGPCRRLTTAATIRCHDLLWRPPPRRLQACKAKVRYSQGRL